MMIKPQNLNSSVRLLILLICLFFFESQLSAQKKRSYIETDSALQIGVKLISRSTENNSQFILLQKKKDTIKLTPNEIKAYGLKNGRVYRSKRIYIPDEPSLVFLELLSSGEIDLY